MCNFISWPIYLYLLLFRFLFCLIFLLLVSIRCIHSLFIVGAGLSCRCGNAGSAVYGRIYIRHIHEWTGILLRFNGSKMESWIRIYFLQYCLYCLSPYFIHHFIINSRLVTREILKVFHIIPSNQTWKHVVNQRYTCFFFIKHAHMPESTMQWPPLNKIQGRDCNTKYAYHFAISMPSPFSCSLTYRYIPVYLTDDKRGADLRVLWFITWSTTRVLWKETSYWLATWWNYYLWACFFQLFR